VGKSDQQTRRANQNNKPTQQTGEPKKGIQPWANPPGFQQDQPTRATGTSKKKDKPGQPMRTSN